MNLAEQGERASEPPLRRARLRFHGPRIALALGLAVFTYLLFPASPAVDFPVYEVGSVASDNDIAPFTFSVPQTESELTKERDAAAATVEHRQQSPFQHARAFMEDTGVIVPNEAFFFGVTPGNCVIVDLVNRTTNERTRMSLSLMPMSQNQPWQVDYAFKVPTQYRKSLDGLAPANTFPTPETLAPIQPGSERALGQR